MTDALFADIIGKASVRPLPPSRLGGVEITPESTGELIAGAYPIFA
jgi:hypothetical protein